MLGKLSHSGGREWCVALVSQEERRETKGNTDYFPVAHFSLLINQTSNIPRSSSIKNVKKNLREVPSVQPKHRRRISVKHNWNSRCPDPVCVCVWARQLVITDNSLYGGTPHPTSVPNWNQNHADNYFFTTLKMTVINCYQQYPPKVTSCICIKRKSTLLAILNAFLYIYNILGVFPQALIQQIYIHETDQIVPRLIPQ